jgi:Ran GTPase-activating protein (RanGAP) involved in mRNA processing and transport
VRRVEPSAKLISQLKQANPLQKAVIYAKNGIWVESISTLAQLRREYPQNLRVMDYWRSLLKSVDLQDISQQPFK